MDLVSFGEKPKGKRCIVLTGATGQLGQAIKWLVNQESTGVHAVEVDGMAGNIQLLAFSSQVLDVTDHDAVSRMLDEFQPAVLINAAAYTHVDQAERDGERAYAVNSAAVAYLATATQQRNMAMFHVSTDYVFDGLVQRPYTEFDTPCPINVYGRSKLAGEQVLLESHSKAMVIRTSSVFSRGGQNFVNGILNKAQHTSVLEVVNDQVVCPTVAADLAAVIWQLVLQYLCGETMIWGLFHYAGQPACSRYEWACKILESGLAHASLGRQVQVVPVPTKMQEGIARRPRYSALNCNRMRAVYGIEPSDWQRYLGPWPIEE